MERAPWKSRLPGAVFAAFLAALTLSCFWPFDAALRWGALALLGLSLFFRSVEVLPSAVLLFLMSVGSAWYPEWVWRLPPLPFFVPLVLTAALLLPFRRIRGELGWLRIGKVDPAAWILVVVTSLGSAVALVLWALWTDYLGVATKMLGTLKTAPVWLAVFAVVPGFALLNAAAEELIYRGVLQESLRRCFPGRLRLVIGLQASAFAAAHFHGGFPNGKLGYLMVFVYAWVLGFLRERSGGMLAPYLTHVAADVVIGVTLVLLANA